jgi:hypothetical protein
MATWIKPTLDTKFHIDMEWWSQSGRNFRAYLLSHLCADCRVRFQDYRLAESIDWVDAETAEVTQVDGLWHTLRTCCSLKPDYTGEHTPLTTAVFRTFLANGNEPLTSEELATQLHRPADTILKTLSGLKIYDGMRPVKAE